MMSDHKYFEKNIVLRIDFMPIDFVTPFVMWLVAWFENDILVLLMMIPKWKPPGDMYSKKLFFLFISSSWNTIFASRLWLDGIR